MDDNCKVYYDTYNLDDHKLIIAEEVMRSFKGEDIVHYDSENHYIEMTIPDRNGTLFNILKLLPKESDSVRPQSQRSKESTEILNFLRTEETVYSSAWKNLSAFSSISGNNNIPHPILCARISVHLGWFRSFHADALIPICSPISILPDYVAKKKYPSKHRPPVILMDKNNMVNFTFHLMDMALAEGQLKKAAEGFVKSMKQVYVNAKFQELQYGERNDGGKIAWLAYETMAIDADIFNIMFITPLEGKLLYGSFNCILGMQDEWEEIAMYCIRTITKVEEEQQ